MTAEVILVVGAVIWLVIVAAFYENLRDIRRTTEATLKETHSLRVLAEMEARAAGRIP